MAETPPESAPDPVEVEKRRRLRGFLNHLIAYFAVMVVLVPVNAVLDPTRAWFVLPLVGWGAPLALHAAYAMGLVGKKPGAGA
ncbi:2TM domain-containing protein [Azospirillum sp. TSO22-1]|uniref:2TM domain-containing protein n=1 Tax=Azospirillum sp. TSO22-1 TaxID=716789 RepID=UPI000D651821|nr:2TM domain-containing protein [Azospirillum sp. TSO22-1]